MFSLNNESMSLYVNSYTIGKSIDIKLVFPNELELRTLYASVNEMGTINISILKGKVFVSLPWLNSKQIWKYIKTSFSLQENTQDLIKRNKFQTNYKIHYMKQHYRSMKACGFRFKKYHTERAMPIKSKILRCFWCVKSLHQCTIKHNVNTVHNLLWYCMCPHANIGHKLPVK